MTQPSSRTARKGRPGFSRAADAVVRRAIAFCGWLAIAILGAIFVFLLLNSMKAIRDVGLMKMIPGTDWYPTTEPPKFGFLPSEVGSLWVTGVALILAVPIGVAAAVYLSEFAGGRLKDIAKSIVEFMAAVPSVVLGLLGVAYLAPVIQRTFRVESGLTALTAGVVVGVMTLPTIISISEDALYSVPAALRQGSLALGNTNWQTTYKVVVPAASSGIFAAVMLGMGRAIGETMVVLMLAGNSGLIPTSPLEAARTMTGTIAQEMGEVVRGGTHFSVLFAMGLVLFAITFAINLAADIVLERQRKEVAPMMNGAIKASRVKRARAVETVAKIITGSCLLFAAGATVAIVGIIIVRGAPSISWEFLTAMPKKQMTAGGIWPAIWGTVMLTVWTALFAMPIGISAGIYLAEYAKPGSGTRVVRLSIANMAGVPSIVYGLFGVSLFVIAMRFGTSLISGALTLACLTLPVIIGSTEEALRQVPTDLRQASLALGATKLRTTTRVVLPAAAPGIVTGTILGLSRAAGETAPIMLTAVAFSAPMPKSPFSPVMALPYHLYVMATQAVKPAPTVVWGTAFVLVAGVTTVGVLAAAWRTRQRSKIRW